MKKTIYLDHAAATPIEKAVLTAMNPYFSKAFYNPSATYLAARAVNDDLRAAKARIAGWLGARPTEIIFTAGGTEGNNLAINGIMSQYPEGNIVISAIEHESILKPAQKYDYREAKVSPNGIIDLKHLESLIDDKTVLVSVMYANNEIGTVQPLKDIAAILTQKRARRQGAKALPLLFHTDAAQAANYLDIHVHRLGVDLMTLNGGKIYGPKQSGVLFVKAGTLLNPQLLGGGQELGLRSGTENVAGSIGLATALDLVQQKRPNEVERLKILQALFYDLLAKKIPKAKINGSKKHRLPNNIHITLHGEDNERLIILLDQAGILCAAGSACSASNEEPSHVLRAIGLSDADAEASLRFTMGIKTTESEIRTTVKELANFIT